MERTRKEHIPNSKLDKDHKRSRTLPSLSTRCTGRCEDFEVPLDTDSNGTSGPPGRMLTLLDSWSREQSRRRFVEGFEDPLKVVSDLTRAQGCKAEVARAWTHSPRPLGHPKPQGPGPIGLRPSGGESTFKRLRSACCRAVWNSGAPGRNSRG